MVLAGARRPARAVDGDVELVRRSRARPPAMRPRSPVRPGDAAAPTTRIALPAVRPAPCTITHRRPRSRRWSSRRCNRQSSNTLAGGCWGVGVVRTTTEASARRTRSSTDGPSCSGGPGRGAEEQHLLDVRPARPAAPPPAGRRRRTRRRRRASGALGEGDLLPAAALGRYPATASHPQHRGDHPRHPHCEQGPADHFHGSTFTTGWPGGGAGRRARSSASPQTTARLRTGRERTAGPGGDLGCPRVVASSPRARRSS